MDHDTFSIDDIDLLKAGRHLRLPDGAKLVIGRDQNDNAKLEKVEHKGYINAKALDISGPLALISKDATQNDKNLAASLILTYTKANKDIDGSVLIGDEIISIKPLSTKTEAHQYFVVKV
jgi:tRNA-specific 2-thiouridylase